MRLADLLTSPPPSSVWVLDTGTVALLRRERRGVVRGVSTEVEEGIFEVGQIGLQAVDRERLGELLSPLQEKLGGARRAAVVVSTGWVRSHLLEVDRLPRRRTEVDDVIRWRLKKLLPVLPAELRLASTAHVLPDGRRQLLCLAGYERAFADLEAALAAVGVEPGLVTPRLFALASDRSTARENALVVQQEAGFLSLLLITRGTPRLLRTKPLARGGEWWPAIEGELRLTLGFIRHELAVEDQLRLVTSVEDEAVEPELRGWWAGQEGIELAPPLASDDGLGLRLGEARVAPALALLGRGGA